MTNYINIQLIYALPNEQNTIKLKVKPGTTILKAIEESNIANKYQDIDLNNLSVGVYSKIKPLNYILQDNDRIEIYRELKVTKKIEKTASLKVEI